MDHAITPADIQLLTTIKSQITPEPIGAAANLTRLLIFGLAVLKGPGTVQLSRSGERLLFQNECRAALEGLANETAPEFSEDAARWLSKSGFITDAGHGEFAITSRGRLWLKSLRDEDALRSSES